MNSALQVPKAINLTFDRIQGRIYDIQREIEYASNNLDRYAIRIQRAFRRFRCRIHYKEIQSAVHRTIRRDCAPIHETLLAFLLSYAKADDHFRLLLNRRFLARNRSALRYWRRWCLEEKEAAARMKLEIGTLQYVWLSRRVCRYLRDWKALSFSKHSRKALQRLHRRIDAEVRRRMASHGLSPSLSLFEQLTQERHNVIIDFARENYGVHMKSIVVRFWRIFVEISKRETRDWNAMSKQFWVRKKKLSFFRAWFSLSVGRIVVFGGYDHWRRPENRRVGVYRRRFETQLRIINAWRFLCVRRRLMEEFRRKVIRKFVRRCFLAYRETAATRQNTTSQRHETYLVIMRRRLTKVFEAWQLFTQCEGVRKGPMKFLLERSIVMRKYRTIRRCYRRWVVRSLRRQTQRMRSQASDVEAFVGHWKAAGAEMRTSRVHLANLGEKLVAELQRRKGDLMRSQQTAAFMRDEQRSLIYALRGMKLEIEGLHRRLGKSCMKYFVDVKPIHDHVVRDVPAALANYFAQKEAEQARLQAQKVVQIATLATPTKQTRAKLLGNEKGRRRSVFPVSAPAKKAAKPPAKVRKSVDPGTTETVSENTPQESG
jgi:hypothetical protein